jgi:vacuolar-type H+-ATPase subunit E/Vma4
MSNMFLNIVSTFKGDGIKQATSQLGAFGSVAGGLGLTLGKVGATLAGFGLAAKAVQFTSQSIDSARDLERNMYSLETVFDSFAPTMEKFVENAYEIGLSQKDAAKASVFLGSVLKQSGFSMEAVTEQSQKLVSLGVDLAATYGYDVQEALLGMTALFRGEYDPIEKFGVAMKQSEINAELAARGQDKLSPALRRNAEQIVRMELLYERAADATGAFTGQSGNLFVEQMKLQAQFENMQASIGTQLLPVMVSLTEALVPLVEYIGPKIAEAVTNSLPALQGLTDLIKDMSDTTTTTGQTVEFLTTTLGDLFGFVAQNFGVLAQLALLIGGVTIALQAFAVALTFITAHPIIATLTLLAGLFIVGANAANNMATELEANKRASESLNPELKATAYQVEYVGGKMGYLAGATSNATKEARALRDELLRVQDLQIANTVFGGTGFAGLDQARALANKKTTARASAAAAASKAAQEKAAREQLAAQQQAAREQLAAQEKAARELADAQQKAWKTEEERLQKLADAYESFADSVKSTFGNIKESILSAFSLPDLGNSVKSITRNISKLLSRTRDFARNITSLSDQGLTNDLLQQVIAAGPMQGAKLAQSLAGAGSGFISQINQAYSEFGGIASGIAGVGTRSAFAGQQTINNYSIEVTGGLATGSDVGRAVVNAIKDYERQSGAAWRA